MNPPRLERGADVARRVAVLLLGAVFLGVGTVGCDSSSVPRILPPPPPPPPPATRLAGDYRTSARCGPATLTVEGPVRVDSPRHYPFFAVDIAVESPLSEAMLLDFREWYDTTDWRVRSSGGRVRHQFRVYWDPWDGNRSARASPPGVWPMTILACPEEEGGPVLACSETSCALYESEDEVPEVPPAAAHAVIRGPWAYGEVREVREGETLEIPLSYEVYRDIDDIDAEIHLSKAGGAGRNRASTLRCRRSGSILARCALGRSGP